MTSIQDLGRKGLAYYAIPTSGVMDQNAAQLANQLIGNEPSHPIIECTSIAPTLSFLSDAIIAITGAEANWVLNKKKIKTYQLILIKKGDTLSGKQLTNGLRSYIAIKGQIKSQIVYGSASCYLNAGIGGHAGRLFQKGDIIEWEDSTTLIPEIIFQKNSDIPQKIKTYPGPEYDSLTPESKVLLKTSSFMVSPNSNRMGARLTGAKLQCSTERLLHSVPVFPGVIQLPPSGQPIVVLQDGQTTGGYPRILYIPLTELNRFNQIPINIPFRLVK